jgi:membrane fusion protein (multidrug efflux system)
MRAVCTDGARNVMPGSFAEIKISLGENTQAVTVPTEAVVPDIKGQKVFIVKAGKAAAIPVITGVRESRDVEIVSGVAPGDTVVTTGVLMLKPGMAVSIKSIE